MTEEQINEVAVLRRAGNTPREIAQMLGVSYTTVLTAQGRARDMGLLPPKPRPKPRQTARNYIANSGFVMGRVSDVVIALSKEQTAWLLIETERLGCKTISEYLTELVRDEYERENEHG